MVSTASAHRRPFLFLLGDPDYGARDPSGCPRVIRLSGSASRLALVQSIAVLVVERQRAVAQQSPQEPLTDVSPEIEKTLSLRARQAKAGHLFELSDDACDERVARALIATFEDG
jgi:hypothetical protein